MRSRVNLGSRVWVEGGGSTNATSRLAGVFIRLGERQALGASLRKRLQQRNDAVAALVRQLRKRSQEAVTASLRALKGFKASLTAPKGARA